MIVLKATQDKVLAVLQSVSGICERRHTLPILANVLGGKNSISNGFPEQGGGGAATAEAEASDCSGGPPALLAFEPLSHYVSFGRSRIYQLIAQGEFPAPVKIGKSSRWVRAEIDTWISHQSQQRTEA